MIRCISPIFLLLCVLTTLVPAVEKTYTPKTRFPMLVPSCWNAIEPLNDDEIYCGIEDDSHILWFATDRGLVSYDGYDCEQFPYPEDFQNTKAIDIFTHSNSGIYVSNENGILLLKDGEWKILIEGPNNIGFPQSTFIFTPQEELFTYRQRTLYKVEKDTLISCLQFDQTIDDVILFKKQFWILTSQNVFSYTRKNGTFMGKQERLIECRDKELVIKTQTRFSTNGSSEIWLLGYHKFPLSFDFESNRFEEAEMIKYIGENHLLTGAFFAPDELLLFGKGITVRRSSGQWEILDIGKKMPDDGRFHFFRKNGNLVVGGRGEKTLEIDFNNERWSHLENIHFQCEDISDNQWFLSEKGQVIQKRSEQIWIEHEIEAFDCPNAINVSDDGVIWVSGGHNSSAAIAFYKNQEWTVSHYPELTPNIHYQAFLQKSNGDILFGATGETAENGGLVVFENIGFQNYSPHVLFPPESSPMVSGLVESHDSIFSAGERLYQNGPDHPPEEIQIAHSKAVWIDAIVTDTADNVWVGLWEDGAYRWNGENWKHFTAPRNILNKHVSSLAYDSLNQRLWVGTKRGISLFKSQQQMWVPNAITQDIFLPREANSLKLERSGALWINSASRGWFLRTNEIIQKPLAKDYFYSKRFNPDSKPPVVKLTHHESTVSETANILISWEGTDFRSITPQSELTYSYKLNDNPWSEFNTKKSQIFFQLKPGTHRISVKCRDLDGNISIQAAESTFVVRPIIIKQKWFILTTTSILLLVVTLIVLLVKQRIVNIIRMEEFKLQFFTNISHELRTPLTVILGPLQNYLKNPRNSTDREQLTLAHKNAQKMLKLVDQILDFRKIEMGKNENRFIHGDIVECIQDAVKLNQSLMKENAQNFTFTFSTPSHTAWFDIEKIEKIVDNLLLNSIKYTPAQGEISIRLNLHQGMSSSDQLVLVFEDSGVGIPQSKIHEIFEPYVRLKNDKMTRTRGTGLGLTFVKSLVESMEGKIEVFSPTNERTGTPCGTKFTVILPVYKKNPTGEDIDNLLATEDEILTTSATTDTVKPRLLMVEDDQDILEYLSRELAQEFRITTCRNGKTAFKKAQKLIPDIIVTDIMMLHMDGRQLCEQIKSTPETAHIPVIMLTALKAAEHELKGLEKGADDYLVKPVQVDILKHRIHNQLNIRKRLLAKKEKRDNDQTANLYSNETMPDEAFVDRFQKEIEASFQNPLFDVKLMAKQMRMNRTTLYRKIKSITGKTPSQHIKEHRMLVAQKLLEEAKFNISEISDKVGFSEVSYFSTTFKKHFNCTPKKYQEQNKVDKRSSNPTVETK